MQWNCIHIILLSTAFSQALVVHPPRFAFPPATTRDLFPDPKVQSATAFTRAKQVLEVVMEDVVRPFIVSTITHGVPTDWEHFWRVESFHRTNAEHIVHALERLGPTYVKFGQALSTRQDLIPRSLANALAKLQDDMAPFDNEHAREILRNELGQVLSTNELIAFLNSLSDEPVVAASIGQVYKGYLPDRGHVAVKVQRPNIRTVVEQDAAMLRQIATWIESLPGVSASESLIATNLVDVVDEFMTRVLEELDYQNEARNMETFAELYSYRNGTFPDVKVVVPNIHRDLCTDSLLVMEWIDGEKLASVGDDSGILDEATRVENLAMVEAGIAATLSQLLGTGLMHSDPHTGNLLKVQTDQGLLLGFLDFGMLSTVPETVRDALVCAVVQLVFARDTEAVADLFGELDLLPDAVVKNPTERLALAKALDDVFRDVLSYPDAAMTGGTTSVPVLRFEKLLAGLSFLVARFQFTLPPYFLNNARALGTLEGLARKLDPSFNSLQTVYPYALRRILQNPSMSPIVEDTILSLIKNRISGKFDGERIKKLLDETSLLSGKSRRQVIRDVLSSKSGKKIARIVATESLLYGMHRKPKRKRILFQL